MACDRRAAQGVARPGHAARAGGLVSAILALALALAGCGSSDEAPDPTVAKTEQGMVRGVEADQIVRFLGIPYAAAPTGDLRFRPPQARAAWVGELDASKPGPVCPQAAQQTTEDCLYLNVWRPRSEATRRPVYVWIHGGGFVAGAGSAFDGSTIARTADAIVVTINYRMGIFGYLAHPAIESQARESGNFGVQDSQAALRWVRDNIAAFGGDPGNVTLGGESGGAMTTCLNLASPAARGLFHKAIIQSGPCAFQWPTIDQKYTQEVGIPAQLGCSGTPTEVAACLRSPNLSVARILAVQAALPPAVVFPTVGGTVVPAQPRTALGSVPMLAGFMAYEVLPGDFSYQRTLGAGVPNPGDNAAYVTALTPLYGSDAPAIAAAYPLASFPNGNWALNTIESDYGRTPKGVYIAICTNVRSFETAHAASASPMYAYEFNDANAPASQLATRGPVHAGELQYVFPTAALPGTSQGLSEAMVGYWSNFIRSGNPNGQGLPAWPAYARPTDVIQLVPGAVSAGKDVNANHKCGFWNSLGFAL